MTTTGMRGGAQLPGGSRNLFVRNATGLVRELNAFDAFNLVFSAVLIPVGITEVMAFTPVVTPVAKVAPPVDTVEPTVTLNAVGLALANEIFVPGPSITATMLRTAALPLDCSAALICATANAAVTSAPPVVVPKTTEVVTGVPVASLMEKVSVWLGLQVADVLWTIVE